MVDDQIEPQEPIEGDVSASATDEQGFTFEDDAPVQDEQEGVELEAEGDEPEAEAEEKPSEQKVQFSPEQQEVLDKVIAEKTRKTYEERQRAEKLEKQLAELRQQVPQPQMPDVPPAPNPDDYWGEPEKYQQAIQERDAALLKRAEFDAQLRQREYLQAQQARQAQEEQLRKQEELSNNYLGKAKEYGIDQEQVVQDAAFVSSIVRNPEVQNFVASDEHGALITRHLARNPQEAEQIAGMTATQAAVYIATQVKPKLSAQGNKSTTPKPAKHISGGGAAIDKSPALDGVKFE